MEVHSRTCTGEFCSHPGQIITFRTETGLWSHYFENSLNKTRCVPCGIDFVTTKAYDIHIATHSRHVAVGPVLRYLQTGQATPLRKVVPEKLSLGQKWELTRAVEENYYFGPVRNPVCAWDYGDSDGMVDIEWEIPRVEDEEVAEDVEGKYMLSESGRRFQHRKIKVDLENAAPMTLPWLGKESGFGDWERMWRGKPDYGFESEELTKCGHGLVKKVEVDGLYDWRKGQGQLQLFDDYKGEGGVRGVMGQGGEVEFLGGDLYQHELGMLHG